MSFKSFVVLAFAAVGLNLTAGAAEVRSSSPLQILSVGGGSSHDYEKWFNEEDSKTFTILARAKPSYTAEPANIAELVKHADVLNLSLNQPIPQEAREAIFAHAKAGKGLVLLHAGLWYNWKDWPEYNRELAGGGARSHDKFQEFEVTVTDPSHPIMKGVPQTFKITDELYHFNPATNGAAAKVLATGKSPTTGKEFPVVWISQHPNARVACITLGHDGKAHTLDAFKSILVNSVKWVGAGKEPKSR